MVAKTTRGLKGIKGPKGDTGSRGEKGDHGQDGLPGRNGVSVTPEIYITLGNISARLDEHDKRFDSVDRKLDAILGNCAARAECKKQVEINTSRLLALDNIENGAVPELQHEMTKVTTRIAVWGGMFSGGVILLGVLLRLLKIA